MVNKSSRDRLQPLPNFPDPPMVTSVTGVRTPDLLLCKPRALHSTIAALQWKTLPQSYHIKYAKFMHKHNFIKQYVYASESHRVWRLLYDEAPPPPPLKYHIYYFYLLPKSYQLVYHITSVGMYEVNIQVIFFSVYVLRHRKIKRHSCIFALTFLYSIRPSGAGSI